MRATTTRPVVLILTALAALATLTLAAAPTDAATADARRCISHTEYGKIHRGMSKARVAVFAGGRGLLAEGDARTYRSCAKGRVLVQYTHTTPTVVVSKHRVGSLASDPLSP